ncbi:DUF742 domain-containing protein [Micromonospora parathelypteridis]|uniref:DUF742 domain-containing protein n=1 Tax=Micromonospora parathelypteridis TaxID=1839617 RepID=A0A840VPI6_9ACTN|nr:DUF742 domain-containing protein [Micromonospora parathelypteridis]MBB5477886.1 hypothetical protein [Micromonospora parathelypteridis]GGO12139.1 hypothetical protein GCM10011576_21260 [Micromonospora parathelypteridis]
MTPDVAGEDPDPEPQVRIRPYLHAAPPTEDGTVATPAVPQSETGGGRPTGPRPFVLTSGRVAGADPAIGLETQVTVRTDSGWWAGSPNALLAPEVQAIIALCAEPISVAEISARARLHFGVTRVLVGDLRAAGHLDVHVTDTDEAFNPDLILRVIDGLRAIS